MEVGFAQRPVSITRLIPDGSEYFSISTSIDLDREQLRWRAQTQTKKEMKAAKTRRNGKSSNRSWSRRKNGLPSTKRAS